MRIGDNSFTIATSLNVAISYDPAGAGERILAFIIDALIKAGYTFFVVLIGYSLAKLGTGPVFMIFMFIICLPLLLYTLLFETFMQGQTPGKKARKIKVVKVDGEQAEFGAYLLRWLFLFVDVYMVYPLIGVIAIAASKKGQRIGDMVANTTVVKIKDTISLKDTIYEKLNQSYEVVYPEAKRLSEDDIELIKKVLNTPEYRDNYDMFYTLTNKIQAKMDVLRKEASSEEFLKTVVRDYNASTD